MAPRADSIDARVYLLSPPPKTSGRLLPGVHLGSSRRPAAIATELKLI